MTTIAPETTRDTASLGPFYVPAGVGPYADLGDHRARVKVGAQATDGGFLLAEIDCDYLGGVPPHIHRREDETFYILEGDFTFLVGGEKVEVGPGDTVFGPRGVAHAWTCLSENGGRVLIAFTPGDNFQTFAMGMAQNNFVPKAAMESHEAVAFTNFAAHYGIEMISGE